MASDTSAESGFHLQPPKRRTARTWRVAAPIKARHFGGGAAKPRPAARSNGGGSGGGAVRHGPVGGGGGQARVGGAGAGGGATTPGGTRQRVVVKASFTRHGQGERSRGGKLQAHARYIERDGTGANGRKAKVFTASEDAVNARDRVRGWRDDRHHFRIIVSPERGADLDLRATARGVARRMEARLGTKLEWVAAAHHNTAHPHVHLVVRGKRDDGRDLVMPKAFIKEGLRREAETVVTASLGLRTERDRAAALLREAERPEPGWLDTVLVNQQTERGDIDLARLEGHPYLKAHLQAVRTRLATLRELGLAEQMDGPRWRVGSDLVERLRERVERQEIAAQVRGQMSQAEAGRVRPARVSDLARGVTGRVVAQGPADELSDARFVAVRTGARETLHVTLTERQSQEPVANGSYVRLGRAEQGAGRADRWLAEVATANDGRYTASAHEVLIRQRWTRFNEADIAPFVASHVKRLETLQRAGIVRQERAGVWAVPANVAERAAGLASSMTGAQGKNLFTRMERLTETAPERMVEAQAWTFLDAELARQSDGQARRVTGDPAMDRAVKGRAAWLVENGLATRTTEGETRPTADARARLAGAERAALLQRAQALTVGKEARWAVKGAAIEGVYRGTLSGAGGTRAALIERAGEIRLLAVTREPDVAIGQRVSAVASSERSGQVRQLDERDVGKD